MRNPNLILIVVCHSKICQDVQLTSYSSELKTSVSPFLFLAVDLPPPPLFQDAVEKNIIPQVSIHSVLAKYDGRTAQVGAFHALSCIFPSIHLQESVGQLRQYKCQRLPPYIILHFKRFAKNAFVEEKNPTIINFPLLGLDFKECITFTLRIGSDRSSHFLNH